ncbi:hypothetical protein PC119_g10683 [Phytophthora cactorum]|uniref:Tc1-like transposase DDE domain-containing protein n=1 Tax=Phytophthora cactorum TaxID=29920 RepID=A0A8T1DH15_9STRA|nr:hypothetical protein PC111_g22858 [Phytophthora cactorum]KAG2794141.1 hypothetical protein PC112_g23154 [Phytophthora cactorum]KAG2855090.1 hypothetical protein PC113_g12745 [Phytophthora cactorum]KAG2901052.1 hypothetical protein PC114_g13332 [Phytophthora cactorum]KAG2914286.1 hypothetical protein PC115_g11709 [Phytophthora cactorum]
MEADDYHGNFNAAKFEKWFINLCMVLKEKHGGCNIHMDGASYHKRQINKAPTMKSNRAEIMKWLAKHGEDQIGQIIDEHRPKAEYHTQKIAVEYDHLLYFTPPYHLALQPIELIWAQVKGPIGRAPASNTTETVQRVIAGLKNVEWMWLSLFRHVQGVEDKYAAVAKARQDEEAKSLANTDVADDCSADSAQN